MTTMIERFFGMPQALLRKGVLRGLSGTGVKLLAAIYYESERCCTRRLKLSTAELRSLTGSSRNSLAKARAELVNLGLVQVEMSTLQEFIIELCDPETGKPSPGDPKQRIRYQEKSQVSPAVPENVFPTTKPEIESRIEAPEVECLQSEILLSRNDPGIADRSVTDPVLSRTQLDIPSPSGTSYDIGLEGASFPFGYNAPRQLLSGPNSIMESLQGIFD